MLINALERINRLGNESTHTQNIMNVTDDEFKKVVDSLFDLYAYLFVEYFEKYEFGSNPDIMSAFSILPPIIRYITLDHLHDKYPENVCVIDKLSLAILKSFDKKTAFEWLENNRADFEMKSTISEVFELSCVQKYGRETFEAIRQSAPLNLYVSCIERVEDVSIIIEKNGKAYVDFESALKLYKEKGVLEGNNNEILEFNKLMEFVYLGRKEVRNDKLNNIESYQTVIFG